jgi:hypothetical protein
VVAVDAKMTALDDRPTRQTARTLHATRREKKAPDRKW